MPKLTLTALASLFLFQLSTLAQDTTWYDATWKPTTANRAFYFRTKIRTDSGWLATDHYRNGKVQMTGLYSDDSLHVRHGIFRWYDQKLKGDIEGAQREGQWIGNFHPVD